MDITLQREKMAYIISLEIEIAMHQCNVYIGPTGWTAQMEWTENLKGVSFQEPRGPFLDFPFCLDMRPAPDPIPITLLILLDQ